MKKIKKFILRNRSVPVFLLVCIALLIVLLGAFINGISSEWIVRGSEGEINQTKLKLLSDVNDENEALKEKLERSATYQTPDNVKELSRFYIRKYFGKDAPRVEQIMWCESGLDPKRGHENKPGLGKDWGLYQINDKWHKARFEKMFGIKFEVGVLDYDMSSQYAKFLWDHSGPSAWVCNGITK